MTRHLLKLAVVLSFAGCISTSHHPADTEAPWVAYPGKKCPVSTSDVVVATAVAKQSEYQPGGPIFFVQVLNQNEINVMYGNEAGGAFVRVKRVHGRWQALFQGGWNS